mgnify:CR=1 FL=1
MSAKEPGIADTSSQFYSREVCTDKELKRNTGLSERYIHIYIYR